MGEYNLTIRRGETFSRVFRFQQPDKTPVDLTGWNASAQIRRGRSRTAALIADFTVSMADPVNGEVEISLTSAQTVALPLTGAYYDLLTTDASGADRYCVSGEVDIRDTVTVKP